MNFKNPFNVIVSLFSVLRTMFKCVAPLQGLDSKLNSGSRWCRSGVDTSLDYLVRELAKHLSQQSVKRINRKATGSSAKERKKRDPALVDLVNKKAIVDAKVTLINFLFY